MKNLLFCSVAVATSFTIYAQRNANWYTGVNNGMLYVNNSMQSPVAGSTNVYDNTSSISSANGALLFYSDGLNVYNSQHQVMQNGSGLLGNHTAGQCALIVPIPCSAYRYAVFYPTEFASPGYLRYSYVDMSANAGLGAVEVSGKNTSLGTNFTEKLCAYYNAQGNFYWVVSHMWASADFVAIKVDASGVTSTSVVSTVGSVHNCGVYSGAHDAMGQLTISPDGTKLANALTCTDVIELFDFNVVTGQVSNAVQLLSDGGKAWGTAFSADSKILYTNSIFSGNVYQFDVSSGIAATIQNSRNKIGDSNAGGYSHGYMELAADNRIYFPRPNSNAMAAIASPNVYGIGCNYNPSAFQTNTTGFFRWGISRIAYNIPNSQPSLGLSISTPTFCAGQTVTVSVVNGTGTYLWNQTLGGTSMTFAPQVATTVTVSAVSGCQTQTIALNPKNPSSIEYGIGPTKLCIGQSATLTAFGGTSFFWNGVLGTSQYTFTPMATNTVVISQPSACASTTLYLQAVPCITGLKEESFTQLKIVPNPVKDILRIECNGNCSTNFSIYNMLGELVKVKKQQLVSGQKLELEVADLPAGTYLIQLENGANARFVKL